MNEQLGYVLIAVLLGIMLGLAGVSIYYLIDSIKIKFGRFIFAFSLAAVTSIILLVYFTLDFIKLLRG